MTGRHDVRTTDSLGYSPLRDARIASGYMYRVIRWTPDGSGCETIAYYKTAQGARNRARAENERDKSTNR